MQYSTTKGHMKPGDHSPWDTVQHVRPIDDGIEFVSTASHGGFIITGPKADIIRLKCGGWKGWNGDPAILEEDADWAVAVLVFPGSFDRKYKLQAVSDFKRGQGTYGYFKGLAHLGPDVKSIEDALNLYDPGCGTITNVIGTNGGTMPCGSRLNGNPYFCGPCST